MTDQSHPPSISSSPHHSALALEVAKILRLVVPVSMDQAGQLSFIASAVDALEGIRAEEVRDVSAEVRRKITRHGQIVPTIADLVANKRARSAPKTRSPWAAQEEIHRKADEMRAAALGDRQKLSDAFEWERQALIDAGFHVGPYPKPLTASEIEAMPAHIRDIGLKMGFLRREAGRIIEA